VKDTQLDRDSRIKSVEEFVKGYQTALRSLLQRFPNDSCVIPRSIAASIGQCVIWPCKDAAIVLTYADNKDEVLISVKGSQDSNVSELMKSAEVFCYFDELGRIAPVRLAFGPLEKDDPAYDSRIPPDDFSTRIIDFSDVTVWAQSEDRQTEADAKMFFNPAFKKVSIYGWNRHLRAPDREAVKDLKKALVFANVLGSSGEELIEREKTQQVLRVADERIAELEALLDRNPYKDIKELLTAHPDLIHPSYLKCYSEISLGEDQIADFLLVVQEEDAVEYLFVNLEESDTTFFMDSGQTSERFLRGREALSDGDKWLADNRARFSPGISGDSKVRFQLVMGRSSKLSFLQRKELRDLAEGTNCRFKTYDDLVNSFRYEVNEVTNGWDRFEPIDTRLKKLGINNVEDFNRLMETIDQQMREEETAITARSMEAVSKFTSGYSTWLMHRDPLTQKIHEWFD